MNKSRSKSIREKLFSDLGYEPTLDDPKNKIMKDPDFKTVYLAAKKNYIAKRGMQFPKNELPKRQLRLQSKIIS